MIGSTTASPAGPARPLSPATEEAAAAAADPPPDSAPTPLRRALDDIQARHASAADDPAREDKLFDALLALWPEVATDPADVACMLEIARDAHGDPARGRAIWEWADAIAARFPRAATVISMLGSLGDVLISGENSQIADRIDPKLIEQLFRQSLDLEPEQSRKLRSCRRSLRQVRQEQRGRTVFGPLRTPRPRQHQGVALAGRDIHPVGTITRRSGRP